MAPLENKLEDNAPKIERLTYTSKEVCQTLGISVATLWRMNARGFLKPLPGIRHKLYSVAAIKRFAEKGAA